MAPTGERKSKVSSSGPIGRPVIIVQCWSGHNHCQCQWRAVAAFNKPLPMAVASSDQWSASGHVCILSPHNPACVANAALFQSPAARHAPSQLSRRARAGARPGPRGVCPFVFAFCYNSQYTNQSLLSYRVKRQHSSSLVLVLSQHTSTAMYATPRAHGNGCALGGRHSNRVSFWPLVFVSLCLSLQRPACALFWYLAKTSSAVSTHPCGQQREPQAAPTTLTCGDQREPGRSS